MRLRSRVARESSATTTARFRWTERRTAYVVLPWTADTGCDEPQLPVQSDPAVDAGTRLVSPLSAGEIAAITNPGLNGWYALDGNEMDDNAIADNGINPGNCVPRGTKADKVSLGSSGQNPYYLQPESNNAGAIETDPYAPACALGNMLLPRFVVPSPIARATSWPSTARLPRPR